MLGVPVPFPGFLFNSHGREPLFWPKELGLNAPKRPQKLRARKAVVKVVKIKGGEIGVKNMLLLLWALPSPIMIHLLGIPSLLSPL